MIAQMRKYLYFFLFLLFSIRFPLSATPVFASNELLPSDKIIDSDYIRFADIVQIDGEIKGDAFLGGGLVTVNGKIDGDLFILAGKVTVNSQVSGSIRVFGGDVTLTSSVGRNVSIICGSCNITRESKIPGSVLVAGGNLNLFVPKIGRGVRFFGNRLFLDSEVGTDSFIVANQEFILGPNASISGSLKYSGNTQAVLEKGATVGGDIAYQKQTTDENYPRFFGAKTILESYKKIKPVTQIMSFIVLSLIGFILLGLFPKNFEKVVNAIQNRPYASLGWGIIVALGLPVVVVLFTLTIVGIPVALILAFVSYLIYLVVQFISAFFLGRKILLSKFGERRGWSMVLGLFLIFLLDLIPIVGNLIKLFLLLISLGAVVLSYKQPVLIAPRPLPFEIKRRRKS